MTRPHTFSRAPHKLRDITSSFDWFNGLSLFFLIGLSNYFDLGFTTLIWKPLQNVVITVTSIFCCCCSCQCVLVLYNMCTKLVSFPSRESLILLSPRFVISSLVMFTARTLSTHLAGFLSLRVHSKKPDIIFIRCSRKITATVVPGTLYND